jgi:hypothetical protein
VSSHLFGASDPKATDNRKDLQDAFRDKHRDVLQDDNA